MNKLKINIERVLIYLNNLKLEYYTYYIFFFFIYQSLINLLFNYFYKYILQIKRNFAVRYFDNSL